MLPEAGTESVWYFIEWVLIGRLGHRQLFGPVAILPSEAHLHVHSIVFDKQYRIILFVGIIVWCCSTLPVMRCCSRVNARCLQWSGVACAAGSRRSIVPIYIRILLGLRSSGLRPV